MRPIMAGAALGSSAVWPERVWPFWTTSRLVPRAEISFSRPAEADEESPRTATMAATPMAMPRAERPARSLRVRSPTVARRARSEGRSFRTFERRRAGHGLGAFAVAGARSWTGDADATVLVGAVEDDLDRRASRCAGPCRAAMSRSWVMTTMVTPMSMELLEEPQDGLPGRLVEVAGGLVGEHDGRAADQGPGDGDPLALPARELVGASVGTLVEADQSEGVEGPGASLGLGDSGVEEAVGHVVEQRSGARPRRTAGRRSRSGWPAARPAHGRRAGRRRGR